ncbi:cyanate lyase C-terminal domain-containing protein [Cantharellus anzutake]|uniref:cyanate lyase C-terminal domain-containing protein n=1 Tax=Cantharellus anzutake TaxID=1750568 RepID=UPI001905B85F|nr:cyanate lyase C-terminal domain-containing protein [Cantharellus anzutake]KAF8333462.1 cyanate lyase C-terminal domain-containing protein [Cantharellus anzutake]
MPIVPTADIIHPALRSYQSTEVLPYATLDPILKALFEAKARKGLTFEKIASELERDEVWVAALFYGQAKPTAEDIARLSEVLGISDQSFRQLGAQWWPHRGALTQMPPTDPVIYRLYEGVMVYGEPIKAVIHEKFGDGIVSMIDCKVHVEKKPDPKGDRAVITFDGKFLPYVKW